MLRRISTVVAALAMGSAALVAGPAAASATLGAPPAPTISDVAVNPSPVVVTSKDKVTVTFSFVTGNGATAAEAYTKPPAPSVETKLSLTKDDLGAGKAKWSATQAFDRGSKPGTWNLRVFAKNAAGDKSDGKAFEVRQVWETDFGDFDARPDVVRQGDTVTLTGGLRVNSVEGWKALGGAKVYIAFRPLGGSWTRVATTGTNGDGKFWARVKPGKTGWWRAEYDGSETTHAAKSDSDRVDVRFAARDTRIFGFDATPEPVDKGAKLSVNGVLLVENGRWHALPGQRVDILFKAEGSHSWQRVGRDWTDRRGRFAADFTAETSGWWRAVYDGGRGLEGTSSRGDWVEVTQAEPADTRIIRFNAYPEPVKYGKYVQFKGKLQIWDGDEWVAYDGQKVALYFKPLGKKWEYVKTVWTNDSGRFYTKVKDWKSGFWKIVFAGNDEAQESASKLDYVRVIRR